MDQTASAHQEILRHIRECGKNTNLDRRVGIRTRGYYEDTSQSRRFALHIVTVILAYTILESPIKSGLSRAHW